MQNGRPEARKCEARFFHAEETSDKRADRHRIPAIRPAPELTNHFLDRRAFSLILTPLDIGQNFLFRLGHWHLPAGQQVIRLKERLGQGGLVVATLEHPQIGKRERNQLLSSLVEAVARITVVDRLQLRSIEIDRRAAEKIPSKALEDLCDGGCFAGLARSGSHGGSRPSYRQCSVE